MRPTYALFNFEDPICDAVSSHIESTVSGLTMTRERSTTELADIYADVRFAAGGATGQMMNNPFGDKIFSTYRGGELQITIGRYREDTEVVDDLDGSVAIDQDTTSRDTLTHYAARIRYALRQAMVNAQSPHALNDLLTSPKITQIIPGPTLPAHDPELNVDTLTLTWSVAYGIPNSVWPFVIETEDGLIIETEDGTPIEGR